MIPSAIQALEQVPWFAALEPAVLERLAARSRVLTLRPGESLARRGEPQTRLSIVLAGGLEIAIHGRDGKRHVVRHLHEREVFGLIPVLDDGASVHDADAHGLTEVLQIPREALLAELATQPALAMGLMRLMCQRFRQLYELFSVQHLLPINARVAHLLMNLINLEPQGPQAAPADIEVHLTQTELSDMLGVSRQSLSIELKKLEREGLIRLAHAKCVIADPVGLERYARALM
ncbi:Crp/Fnr family transcriptional regulator [Pelomonas sp. KK5]|uniref:Crp/Fnr family transcriptional regulator n=1 Tax=Pelomonas sp. KK5 TaxID=1855730 RepID=UPI00097BB64B|nr:Crp/Fnr family transcriptional regulator [Pelomonas sp. KK5]